MNYTDNEKRKLVKDDYDAIADTFYENYNNFDYCKSYIDEFIEKLQGKNVLDIGCGAGQITNYLTKQGLNAIGIDFSQKLLQIATKNFPDSKFVFADICDYTQNERADGIIIKDMLFHLADESLTYTLKNLKNILCPNGVVCIIMDTPKKTGEQILTEELNDKYQVYYNYLSPEKLKSKLKEVGYKINKIELVETKDYVSIYANGIMVIFATNK